VLVVDDHRVFRQGLISLMKTRPDVLQVVGEAGSGKEAVIHAKHLQPDLILMDLYMPDGDGLEATRIIHQERPDVAIVMLTASDTDDDLCKAIKNGAVGYLVKSMDAEDIFDLILGTATGEIAMTRLMGTRLLRAMEKQAQSPGDDLVCLTPREAQVLELVIQGASNPQIAAALCVSLNTAKSHVSHIMRKLNVENRAQIVKYALQHGLAARNDR
jgi:DNA-binding NarL/FixJ family response regulator